METIKFKNMLLAGLMVLTCAAGFTSCSDSDDDKNNESGGGSDTTEVLFNDLLWFQNSIVRVDSMGQFMSRNYGEPLYENDTTNVFIGVETLEEARQMFDSWIAPDAKVTATPSASNVTVTLTDKEGKSQGEVYFKAGTDGTTIAEVTTTAAVRHFRKVSFIPNNAWPHNVQEGKFIKGVVYKMDIAVDILNRGVHENVKVKYESMNMVCIRSQGNGVPPMLISIGKEKENNKEIKYDSNIEYLDLISESDAITASQILQQDWDLFVSVFDEAGNGPLRRNEWYWIRKNNWIFFDESVYAVKLSATGEDKKIDDFGSMWTSSDFYPLYCKTTQFYMKYNSVNYVECSWDDATKTVKSVEKTQRGYYELMGENDEFIEAEGNWYVVTGNTSSNVFSVKGTGNHLIICDGAKLSLKHLNVPTGAELHIHSGPLGTGILNVDNTTAPEGKGVDYDEGAGIGGINDQSMGTLIIHGGVITAKGSRYAAGIGGGDEGHGGTCVIFAGTVKAYGGTDAAGIGGGEDGNGSQLTIYGGMVFANGGNFGAGIGGGQDGNSGTIIIRGGEVHAYGGDDAAGIGTGEEKTGNIKADNITISGGAVEAVGGGNGAGIGAGEDAEVGTITITSESGSVYVSGRAGNGCGWWAGAFGAYKSDYFGTLNIGKGVKVLSIETDYTWSTIPVAYNPVAFAQQRCHVQLRTCDHPGYSASTCIYCKH